MNSASNTNFLKQHYKSFLCPYSPITLFSQIVCSQFKQKRHNKYCWLLSLGIFFVSSTPTFANSLNKLDSNLRSPATFYLTKDIKSNRKSNSREYNFKAPDSKTITNTEQLIKARGYRVEVFGSESELLQEVRNIEPSAFVKGDTIQVGIFSQQANAENMVRQLAVKGFWARIKLE